MNDKRGQFYIVAAIIIVLAISGIMSLSTYAVAKPSPKTIYDLSSDLKKEGTRIVDYGIYSKENVKKLMDDFTDKEFAPYFLQKTNNANVLFVYGNETELYGVRYDTVSTGTVSATIGNARTDWNSVGVFANRTIINDDDGNNIVEIIMMGKTFEFEIKDNEMFYFVIIQEREGETYVEKN